MDLEKLFAAAPAPMDADGFAARVSARLDRNWTYRQALIGGLGLVGGLIGGAQFLGSGLFTQLASGLAQTNAVVGRLTAVRAAAGTLAQSVSDTLSAGSPFDTRILMMSVTLAAVAGGLFVTRALREI